MPINIQCKKVNIFYFFFLIFLLALCVSQPVLAEGDEPVIEPVAGDTEIQQMDDGAQPVEIVEVDLDESAFFEEINEENPDEQPQIEYETEDQAQDANSISQSGQDDSDEGNKAGEEIDIPAADVITEEDEITEEDGIDVEFTDGLELSEDGLESDPQDNPDLDNSLVEEIDIVSEEGSSIELSNQDNASLINGTDPYWKVGTQYYSIASDEGSCYVGTSVAGGTCWVDTPVGISQIQYALMKIEESEGTLLPSDKKLYVLTGTYEGDITFSGTYLSQMIGLIGVDGSDAINIIGTVTLDGMTSGFTLSGFTISGGILIQNSRGNIVLKDLNVSNDNGSGVYIAGTESRYLEEYDDWYEVEIAHGSGSLTITDSTFNNNKYFGAYLRMIGKVTIENSTFSYNGTSDESEEKQTGLYIWTTGVVSLNGVSATGNYGDGINISDFDSATIKNAITNNNSSYTAYEDDGNGIYAYTSNAAKVTLVNIQSNSNAQDGIYIETGGVITATNLEASGNGLNGVSVTTSNAVTITTSSTLNNGLDGLSVSTIKPVKLSTIQSNNNGQNGLGIYSYENWIYDETEDAWILAGYFAPSSVTITSPKSGGVVMTNSFSSNGANGLYVMSTGTVAISNLDSYSNASTGLYIDNCLLNEDTDVCQGKGNVTLNVTISGWKNGFGSNSGSGIYILSNGVVSISKAVAESNSYDGLYVDTRGAIKLDQVEANSNSIYGAYLTNLSALKAQSVSIKDGNFNENNTMGLYVLTAGAINLSGSYASNNYSPTQGGPIEGSVTIIDRFYSSDGSELWGFYGVSGDVLDIILESYDFDAFVELYDSANNLLASNDNGFGGTDARIQYSLTSDDWYHIVISFSGSFEGGGDYTLSFNDEDHTNIMYPGSGAVLDNSAGKANVVISTTKDNTNSMFEGNAGFGLKIVSYGNISITSASANDNSRTGLSLDNPKSSSSITITDKSAGSTFNGNGWEGIYAITRGNITLIGVAGANNNGSNGIYLDNCLYDEATDSCLGSGKILIQKVEILENSNNGLEVFSDGIINMASVTAGDNEGMGIFLQNQYTGSVANIILKSVFAGSNNDTGITAYSNGMVTFNDVSATDNYRTSGYLNVGDAAHDYYNSSTEGDFWGFNVESGVELTFQLFASDNPDWDIDDFVGVLDLFDSDANSISFNSISGDGTGALIATWTPTESGFYFVRITEDSDNNGFYRFSINNTEFTDMSYSFVDGATIIAGRNVTITGKSACEFSNNSIAGLYIQTPGNISLTYITANFNGTEGVYLDNNMDGNGTGKILVKGKNDSMRSHFTGNGWQGLSVITSGAVNFTYLTALYNGLSGIQVGNLDAMTAGTVSAKNIDVHGNGEDGLLVTSTGTILISTISAQGNNGTGMMLDNAAGWGNVTVSGENYFWDNGDDGMNIQSNGNVNFSKIDVRNNGGDGIQVQTSIGTISLTKTFVKNSGGNGIDLTGDGAFLLNDVTSLSNGDGSDGDGLHIVADATSKVTIKNSIFMGNEGNGLDIENENGLAPILSKVLYFGNDTDGDGTADQKNHYIH
ncbi:MAG: putative surface-exposed virulence protein [Chloroflexota bacterium]|nr:putative surface-exposed virulence protein [Chloroflexota bacterium]